MKKIVCGIAMIIWACGVSEGMIDTGTITQDSTTKNYVGDVSVSFENTIKDALIPGMNDSFGRVMETLRGYPEAIAGLQSVVAYRTGIANKVLSIMQMAINTASDKLDILAKACLICYELGCSSKKEGEKLLKDNVFPMVVYNLPNKVEGIGAIDARIANCYKKACEIIKPCASLSDVRSGIWLYLFFNKVVPTREPF
jgi:hypothetical protein